MFRPDRPASVLMALAGAAATLTLGFLGDVLAIVPSVLVLMGLFDVWVPKRLIESRVGAGSGSGRRDPSPRTALRW